MIQVAIATVIISKYITIPITLEVRPNKGSYNLNVAQANRNIFYVIKMNNTTLKIIISLQKVNDTLLQYPVEKD